MEEKSLSELADEADATKIRLETTAKSGNDRRFSRQNLMGESGTSDTLRDW